MRGVQNFIIKPLGSRYNNEKKIGDKNFILNTDIFQHKFVNRHAIVIEAITKTIYILFIQIRFLLIIMVKSG